MTSKYISWGRYPYKEQEGVEFGWRNDPLPKLTNFLPQGNARSYGDSCMNHKGLVVSARHLNRFISFDPATGVIRCEAGVLLAQILDLVEPQGWFLPVTPGTKFVTIAGALANDVHGKNHHFAGTFGNHINCFELLRTDGERLLCSPSENTELFNATIGGLGLTGFVTWVELRLKRVANSALNVETIKYDNLGEFFELSEASDSRFEYTVAWIDCLAGGEALGRGHFIRGNHATPTQAKPVGPKRMLNVPFDPPVSLINKLSLKAFNQLYYHRQVRKSSIDVVHYEPFFYPLDSIGHWNRIYGPKGFLQYQFAAPMETSSDVVREALKLIAKNNTGSFLAVLKVFGNIQSPGLLSFPRPGATLALDFPYQARKTFSLFEQLDELVYQAKGAIYPAKDAHMKAEHFASYYPNLEQFKLHKDPGITSSFWQRVTGE